MNHEKNGIIRIDPIGREGAAVRPMKYLVLLLCIFGCCACSSKQITPNKALTTEELETLEELQTPYIGMILKSLDGEFYPLIKAGAEAEADRLGAELVVVAPDSEADADGQAELVSIMADMALDVLIISPCDETLLTDSLERASEKGKHILAVDERMSYSGCEGYIGSDDYDGAFHQGAHAATLAADSSAVILRGQMGSRNHVDRTMGLRDSLQRSGIQRIDSYCCNSSRTEAYHKVAELLRLGAPIGVICTTDDDMAFGAKKAISESERTIPVVSFDGTPEMLKAVGEGTVDSVMMQDAYEIGVQSVRAAVQSVDNQPVGEIIVPMKLVVLRTAERELEALEQRLVNNE